tara:strand:+ start:862 stop:993 length:132 start_codon:yes stop_codon:yes gene_type:complete
MKNKILSDDFWKKTYSDLMKMFGYVLIAICLIGLLLMVLTEIK